MKLLLTNDDGLQAMGLRSLIQALSATGQHELVVVAPDRERSATAHALTLHQPLHLTPVELGLPNVQAFAVSGTPCDCVKLALHALWHELPLSQYGKQPDAILSGINHGPNLGNDVIYSGTVSAAQEGSFLGLPAVALSLANGYLPEADFMPASQWTANHLSQLLAIPLPANTILNINFPVPKANVSMPVCLTVLGNRSYSDFYERRLDPRQQAYYWLAGQVVDNPNGDPVTTDVGAIRAGCVSITPVTLSLSQPEVLHPNLQQLCSDMTKHS
jgi:5'-nucleotidase